MLRLGMVGLFTDFTHTDYEGIVAAARNGNLKQLEDDMQDEGYSGSS